MNLGEAATRLSGSCPRSPVLKQIKFPGSRALPVPGRLASTA